MAAEEKKTGRFGAGDVALLVVSIVFLVGIVGFFGACDPMEDGSWMSCHWANMAVIGLAAVLVVVSVVHAIVPDAKMKTGLAIATVPVSVLAAVVPGHLISTCMMAEMRCNAVMTPAVLVFSILMIVVAIVDVVLYRRKLDTRPKAGF